MILKHMISTNASHIILMPIGHDPVGVTRHSAVFVASLAITQSQSTSMVCTRSRDYNGYIYPHELYDLCVVYAWFIGDIML